METKLSPDAKCNTCGYQIELATGITGTIPDPGDVSVCIACGTPELFTMCPTGMITRSCTEEELILIMMDESAVKLMYAVHYARENDPDWPKGPKE
jgi:hypothetical protein